MQFQERRSSRRIPFSSKGCAILNGVDIDLKTHDISLGGALVEFGAAYPIREGMKLRVYLNAGFIGRAVVCRSAAGKSGTLYGLKFDRFDFHTDLMLNAFFVKIENHQLSSDTVH